MSKMRVLKIVNDKEFDGFMCSLISVLQCNDPIDLFCVHENIKPYQMQEIVDVVSHYSATVEFCNTNDLESDELGINFRKIKYLFAALKCSQAERMIYISNDTIVHANIEAYYEQGFDGSYIIARAQTFNGKVYIDDREEQGQLFDTRVALFNLEEISLIDLYSLESIINKKYGEIQTDQGVLNCLFKDHVKIEHCIEYNFRHSIYSEAEKTGIAIEDIKPIIISYEKRDYFYTGNIGKPWEFNLAESDINSFVTDSKIILPFDYRHTFEVNKKIFKLWNEIEESRDVKFLNNLQKESRNRVNNDVGIQQKKEEICIIRRILDGEVVKIDELKKVKYKTLVTFIDSLDADKSIEVMHRLFNQNVYWKRKTKVGFIVHSSSEWPCEMLYKKMDESEYFEPYVVLAWQELSNKEAAEKLKNKTIAFFEENYRCVKEEFVDEVIDSFDLLIYISPFRLEPEVLNIDCRNLSQTCIHIPYAWYLISKDDTRHLEPFYDRTIFKIVRAYFASGDWEKNIVKAKQRMKGYNIYSSGYPKIDDFLFGNYKKRNDLWKSKYSDSYKIIWAPHFNMAKGKNGTFHLNYQWFLKYAYEHSNISWIVRPHPRFAAGAIAAGVFKNEDEVRAYFDEWDSLENASVVDGGGYYDIFASSDAMILDSLSFLAEYQYTGKPMLFLLSEIPKKMNEIGEELLKVVYKTKGNDFEQINEFIINVINRNDSMAEQRKIFFDNHLNHRIFNNQCASDYIFDLIKKWKG